MADDSNLTPDGSGPVAPPGPGPDGPTTTEILAVVVPAKAAAVTAEPAPPPPDTSPPGMAKATAAAAASNDTPTITVPKPRPKPVTPTPPPARPSPRTPTTPAGPLPGATPARPQSDWAAEIADRIDEVVGKVRANTSDRLVGIARLVVFGLLAAILGLTAAVLFVILFFRILAVIPGPVWIPYMAFGAILVAAGLLFWSWRTAKPPKA